MNVQLMIADAARIDTESAGGQIGGDIERRELRTKEELENFINRISNG